MALMSIIRKNAASKQPVALTRTTEGGGWCHTSAYFQMSAATKSKQRPEEKPMPALTVAEARVKQALSKLTPAEQSLLAALFE